MYMPTSFNQFQFGNQAAQKVYQISLKYGPLMPPILGLKQISELFGYPFEIHYLDANLE